MRYNNLGKITLAQYWIGIDGMPLAGLEFKYNTNGAVSSTNLYYLHSDHVNTPRMATNASQALLWTWNSDEFGVGLPQDDVDGDGIKLDMPLRFPGQLFDAHSQMHYNYFRDYDQARGRYMESDPIGLEGGLNTYGYVEGNPLRYSDPYGLFRGPTARPATPDTVMLPYVAPCLLCSPTYKYPLVGPEVPAPSPTASIEGLPYPTWFPSGGENWPDRQERKEALQCKPQESNCHDLAISIDIPVRTIRVRRDQMQDYGGGDKGHKDKEIATRKALGKLVREARARRCPYNPEADSLML